MILGGSGLVGHAVARRLLDFHPRHIALVALSERETQETAAALAPLAGDTVIAVEAGDIYTSASLTGQERGRFGSTAARATRRRSWGTSRSRPPRHCRWRRRPRAC